MGRARETHTPSAGTVVAAWPGRLDAVRGGELDGHTCTAFVPGTLIVETAEWGACIVQQSCPVEGMRVAREYAIENVRVEGAVAARAHY